MSARVSENNLSKAKSASLLASKNKSRETSLRNLKSQSSLTGSSQAKLQSKSKTKLGSASSVKSLKAKKSKASLDQLQQKISTISLKDGAEPHLVQDGGIMSVQQIITTRAKRSKTSAVKSLRELALTVIAEFFAGMKTLSNKSSNGNSDHSI